MGTEFSFFGRMMFSSDRHPRGERGQHPLATAELVEKKLKQGRLHATLQQKQAITGNAARVSYRDARFDPAQRSLQATGILNRYLGNFSINVSSAHWSILSLTEQHLEKRHFQFRTCSLLVGLSSFLLRERGKEELKTKTPTRS